MDWKWNNVSFKKIVGLNTKIIMSSVTVSVTCPNCGNPVVFTLEPPICGGISECCYNCGALVSGSYSWGNNNTPVIRYVRSSGGYKKR